MIELCSGDGLGKSLKIGLFGEYCDKNDYVDFGGWREYPIDIQFLIISWFSF